MVPSAYAEGIFMSNLGQYYPNIKQLNDKIVQNTQKCEQIYEYYYVLKRTPENNIILL